VKKLFANASGNTALEQHNQVVDTHVATYQAGGR
jgi:hypothetical protein